jgi:hypothetical protein
MTMSRRLIAVVGALAAVVLLVGMAATRTSASWADAAVFAAQATSGSWDSGENTCQVVDVNTGEVVGSCAVDSVTVNDQWQHGMRFTVTVSGFQPGTDVQAQIRVDMSKFLPDWDWSASTVQMDSAQSVDWSAPILTFTTYPWHASPFSGTVHLSG